jgi:putative hydrolase of the HAD superfamily
MAVFAAEGELLRSRAMPHRFDAVFFDLGGTLFSYRSIQARMRDTIREAVERLGVEAQPAAIGQAYGDANRAAFARYVSRPFYLHRDLFTDTYRDFVRTLTGDEADDEFVEWLYALQRDRMVEAMELREDCLDTLARLRERGLTLSIVSNIDDDFLLPMVETSGLDRHLHHWTSSEEAKSCKPDPGFFRYCVERAGVTAERVLFVGDSPVHDVAGAKAQGMTTVLILDEGVDPPGQEGGDPQQPHHQIRALAELLDIVERA